MSYFNGYYRSSRGILIYIIIAFISAVIGGVAALSLAPVIWGDKLPVPPQSGEERQENEKRQIQPFNMNNWPVVGIAEEVGPAVVGITLISSREFFERPSVSSGSGVIIDRKKGYIVTNYHVIENAREIRVSLSKDRIYNARTVGYDRETDLAVLQIHADDLPEVVLGNSDDLQVGELVVAIGNPLGREFERSVTAGVISALNREISVGREDVTLRVIQTDAAINPGNSGGALVNSKGEVIGINSMKIARTDVEGMGFAIPISDALPVIEQIIEKGYVSRPFIGIYNFQEIDAGVAEYYQIPRGILIGGIISGSPADKAGLMPRDIILKIDGEKMLALEDLKKFLEEHGVGDRVNIEIMRGNKKMQLELKLGERPRE